MNAVNSLESAFEEGLCYCSFSSIFPDILFFTVLKKMCKLRTENSEIFTLTYLGISVWQMLKNQFAPSGSSFSFGVTCVYPLEQFNDLFPAQ